MFLLLKKSVSIATMTLVSVAAYGFVLPSNEHLLSPVVKKTSVNEYSETNVQDNYAVEKRVAITALDFKVIAVVDAIEKTPSATKIDVVTLPNEPTTEDKKNISDKKQDFDFEKPAESISQVGEQVEPEKAPFEDLAVFEIVFTENNGSFAAPAPFVEVKVGDKLKVVVKDKNDLILRNNDEVKIIVSDKSILSYDEDSTYTAKQTGELQIFVTNISAIGRVDLRVIDDTHKNIEPVLASGPQLEVPKEITSIKDIEPIKTSVEARLNSNHVKTLSVEEESNTENQKVTAEQELDTTSFELVVVEDRSHFSEESERKKIYPAVNVKVQILGDSQTYRTSSTGRVQFTSIPLDAEVVFDISDEAGYYRRSKIVAEVDSPNESLVVRLLRSSIFNTYSDISGVVQRADRASLCATMDQGGESARSVSLDAGSDGPYYFNEFGFLDIASDELSANGKFCYFNIETGPALLTINFDDGSRSNQLFHLASSSHLQESVMMQEFSRKFWKLKSLATAREHFSADQSLYNQLRFVDVIDVFPFGSDQALPAGMVGEVGFNVPHLRPNNWFFVSPQAGEFEMTLSRLSEDNDEPILLLPNGFVEDLSYYLAKDYDHALGQVVVMYHSYDNIESERIVFKLRDLSGNPIGEAQYFSAAPMTKAVFFNIPFGSYSLSIEDEFGRWLGESIIPVYEQRTTISSLGKTLN